MNDADIFLKLKEKLAEVADTGGVTRSSRLYHDLGLSGDDYYEFIIWYSHQFQVNLTGMDLSKFSPPDGLNWSLFGRRKYFELRVQDLVELAKYSSWKASGLEERLVRK